MVLGVESAQESILDQRYGARPGCVRNGSIARPLPQVRSFGFGAKVYYRVDKEGAATLMYTSMPPFTRAVLDVQSGTWTILD